MLFLDRYHFNCFLATSTLMQSSGCEVPREYGSNAPVAGDCAGRREAVQDAHAAAGSPSVRCALRTQRNLQATPTPETAIASHRIAAPFVRCQKNKGEDELGEK